MCFLICLLATSGATRELLVNIYVVAWYVEVVDFCKFKLVWACPSW